MKLGIHKKAIALAVLVVVTGSFANAAGGKTKRGGTTTADAKVNTKGTSTQSARINGGSSTTAAPATGEFRRARTGFGTTAAAAPAAKTVKAATTAAPAPRAERPRVAKDTKSSDASAQSPAAKAVAAITKAGLDTKLNGKLPELSASLAKDSVLLGVANEIISTNAAKPQLSELNQGRVEGLLHISKLSESVRDLSKDLIAPAEVAQQAYVALVQNAGREAAAWPETTQKNMVELLTKTNNKIADGMTVEAAIEAARIEMLTVSKVKIDLAQIKRLCGKV